MACTHIDVGGRPVRVQSSRRMDPATRTAIEAVVRAALKLPRNTPSRPAGAVMGGRSICGGKRSTGTSEPVRAASVAGHAIPASAHSPAPVDRGGNAEGPQGPATSGAVHAAGRGRALGSFPEKTGGRPWKRR